VYSSRAESEDWRVAFPNQHRIVVGGLHFVQEDSPDEIGRAITGWLETHLTDLCSEPSRRSP
jgi:hypothetical protein